MKTFKQMKPEKIQPTDLKEKNKKKPRKNKKKQGRLSGQRHDDCPNWDLDIQTGLQNSRETQAVVKYRLIISDVQNLKGHQPLKWDYPVHCGIYKAVEVKSEITIEQRNGWGVVEEMDVYHCVRANEVLFECSLW